MPKIRVAVLVAILIATSLFAQNNRSAVSLTGNDAASCTVPDPCRTFDVAISKTNGSLGGVNGITYSGSTTILYVENCVISGFSSGKGVNFAQYGTLFISELIARGNGTAIFVDSAAMLGSPASIDHALMEKNISVGLEVDHANVAIRDSVASGTNSIGFWVLGSGA